jgi:hypothetical protein
MAHEIETHGNRAAAVFARIDAWHRLGTTDTIHADDPRYGIFAGPRSHGVQTA